LSIVNRVIEHRLIRHETRGDAEIAMSSAEAFSGSRVIATDGMIGRVVDLLFDDERWMVRYLVVNAGDCLPRNQVLISPHSVRFVDTGSGLIVSSLTRSQVAGSPRMDGHSPITRQQEWDYCAYFGYSAYWAAGTYPSQRPLAGVKAGRQQRAFGRAETSRSPLPPAANVRLHSFRSVSGFLVRGTTEQLGRVDDLLFDEGSWAIRRIVVAAGRWFEARRFEVAPEWLQGISWNDRCLNLRVRRADIRRSGDWRPTLLRGS
jgi:uncharacterized protein YrrD